MLTQNRAENCHFFPWLFRDSLSQKTLTGLIYLFFNIYFSLVRYQVWHCGETEEDLFFTDIHIHEIPSLVYAAEICMRLPAALEISAAVGIEA